MILSVDNARLNIGRHTTGKVKDYGTNTVYLEFVDEDGRKLTLSLNRELWEEMRQK